MMDAVIDIVIPVYNPGKVFKNCIKSILNQTYRQWNLILINDGSTDGSEKLCDKYATIDSRIIVIHQKNQGSVAARKNGVLACNPAHFITFCDADDMLTADALEKLSTAANENNADMVCGNSVHVFKGVKMQSAYQPPCFEYKTTYSHKEIIDKLYVSFFGISNFPARLWGKLYRYDLIREAVEQPPVVKFFADDLSVMAYVLPRVQTLTIIPDIIYKYRIGGSTARFMPSMLDDCLSMYHYKRKLALEWPMPQNVDRLIRIELKNMAYTWLRMCCEKGNYTEAQCIQEIRRICNLPEIEEAVNLSGEDKSGRNGFRDMLRDRKYDQILACIKSDIHQVGVKQIIRNLLMKL